MKNRKLLSIFLMLVTLMFSTQKAAYASPSGLGGWIAAGILGIVAIVGITAVSTNSNDNNALDIDYSLDSMNHYDEEDWEDTEETTIPESELEPEIETSSVQSTQIEVSSTPQTMTVEEM